MTLAVACRTPRRPQGRSLEKWLSRGAGWARIGLVALPVGLSISCGIVTVDDPVPGTMKVAVESTGGLPFQVVVSQQFARAGNGFGLQFFAADTVYASANYEALFHLRSPPAVAVEITNYDQASRVRLRIFLDNELHHDAVQDLAEGGTLNFSYRYFEPSQ